ncbi:FDLD family class I lanthipeptide [Kitasatospora sp. NPDC097643]|uniref:FDLD family class I lanthipeptide n=1 Tax=Kitasatospora sp. NPDC097643 TaxID=3157230 RepID=UPI00331D17C0
MPTAVLETATTETVLDDLFDLDIQVEVTETPAEAGFTTWGCSVTCSCFATSLCC